MIAFTILGEPASKANSREIVTIAGHPSSIKSEKALNFERDALKQIPPRARQRLEGPVRVTLKIFYASERPDLDESIVLDVMQDRWAKRTRPERHTIHSDGTQTVAPAKPLPRVLLQSGVYRNDRQVREKHVFWALDRVNPRTEIQVEPLFPQQVDAFARILAEVSQ